MLAKPTLYLFTSGAIGLAYLLVLLGLALAHGPMVPNHINTAFIAVLTVVFLLSALWFLQEHWRVGQTSRDKAAQDHTDERFAAIEADQAARFTAVETNQADMLVKLEELRRLIRMRPVVATNGAVVEPKTAAIESGPRPLALPAPDTVAAMRRLAHKVTRSD